MLSESFVHSLKSVQIQVKTVKTGGGTALYPAISTIRVIQSVAQPGAHTVLTNQHVNEARRFT